MTTNGMNTIRTSDLYFAAFLKVAGVPFLDTENEGRRVFFLFEDVGNIRDLKRQYFGNQAKVLAGDFVSAIRNMKALTHMEGGG